MERLMRRAVLSWNRWAGVLALGAALLLAPMPAASGGDPLTPEELLDIATAELSALLSPMQARTASTVSEAISELEAAAKTDAKLSSHYKTCVAAIGRVEKDSAKVSQKMHRIIDRTIARLERMGATQEFIDQGEGLTIYSEYVGRRPYHASEDIFESLGTAVGHVF